VSNSIPTEAIMRTLFLLVCHVATLQLVCASSTIDRVIVGDLSLYPAQNPSSYTPYQFMYPESVKGHYTSDGTSWQRGAGIGQIIYAAYQGVTVSNEFLYYHFAAPADGILISYTDYGFGENFSTQGTLGYSGELVFVAQQGSALARCTGATTVLDNSPTGSAAFHYYSASVGQSVFFQLEVTIRDSTWQPNTFLGGFKYNGTGFVDFTQVVPEPSTIALFGIGGGVLLLLRRTSQRHHVSA
jgi:hypothetical protein